MVTLYAVISADKTLPIVNLSYKNLDGVKSDENGKLNQTVEIEFYTNSNSDNIMLFVEFDTINQAHPNSVEFNGKTYTPQTDILTLFFNSQNGVANTIKFSTWNKPNSLVIIRKISTSYTIKHEKILNVSFSGDDRSDFTVPSWGIKSNSGSLDLINSYDLMKSLADLAEENIVKINFFLKCISKTEQIGSFVITNISFNRQKNSETIEYKDVLHNWEQKELPYIPLSSSRSLFDVARNLSAPQQLILANNETSKRLEKIIIKRPYIESGSAWANFTKICELSACYIYCDEKGQPTMRYCGGT